MTGAPGLARAVRRRRKFSEAYRHTHVYAWRRLFKAARNVGLELLDLLRSSLEVRRFPGYPYKCHLCGVTIENADDRDERHGLETCVEICGDCCATGLDESQPDPEAANLPCPKCEGRGHLPIVELDGARAVTVVPLRFPRRRLIPRNDAHFDDR